MSEQEKEAEFIPQPGQRVWVRAEFRMLSKGKKHAILRHDGCCANNEECGGDHIIVPLSSIHPAPQPAKSGGLEQ